MKSLLGSEKAVSAVVGMIIILGLTITSISVILLYATPTIDDMQDMANAQKVEQAFTVFDSRTSKVALGESPSQTTSFSIMDGSIKVNGNNESYNDSSMVVICVNISAGWYPGFQASKNHWGGWEAYMAKPEMNQFNASMGSITYTKDERTIGYEGGGVWSKYPSGKAIMISPPEFHYNGETLTLPIMKISGTQASSGNADVDVTISSDNMPVVMYPDPSADPRSVNPLDSDKVLIYIKSEFYDAWADYANSLAYASAVTDDANRTAIIELEVIPAMGKDKLRQTIKIGAVEQITSPMINFTLDLEARASQGLNPNNYQISATSGTKTLTYTIQKSGGANQLEISVIYEDTQSGGGIETWEGKGANVFTVSGSQEDQSASVDLLSTTLNMTYDDKNGYEFSWGNQTLISIGPDIDYSDGDSVPLNDLTQHYMKLITRDGSVVFNLYQPGSSDPVDYDESTITLYYKGMPGSITYLHVSRNDLSASLS
ncbi:MAG: hypothetical protein JW705_01710 [Methanosarcinaceae archaeon]|nr:hypothetical protein [Methanosarcinaceae archaeon]